MFHLLITRFVLFVVVAVFSINLEARAQTSSQPDPPVPSTPVRPQPPTVSIPHTSQPLKLEDALSGAAGQAALKITGFLQREPGDGEPVSQETTVYASYDDKNIYIVFVCKDEPDKIRAHLSKREATFGDDMVGVVLDTFHDRRRAYLFLVNPLGIQLDGIITEGQEDDHSFDTLWHSEGKLTPDGYVVRMAIPFKSLRFKKAETQNWGIAFGRIIARRDESSFWPYITRRVNSFVDQMATLQGIEHISPGRNIQVIPYGFFARARFLDAEQNRFNTETDTRAGVDAKIVLRDSFTLDITANPDFSQVESDEPQVTVNQRFEVFFPEKRPFFLENAGFLQTPENLFFSRRIADPQFGVRLTGKTGPWAMGAILIDDRAPGKRFAKDDPLHSERAGIGVFRLQREFAKQSHLGALITSRDFGGSSNRVYSFDTRIKLNQNWTFDGQAISSNTRLLDGTRLSGPAYFAALGYSDRHFNNFLSYQDRSPSFRTQLGFVPRVDIRDLENFASYRWRPKKSRVQSFGPNSFLQINWNREGRVQDWRINMPFSINWSGPTSLFVRHARFYELFQGQGFHQHSNTISFFTGWLNWLELFANVNQGTGVNFFPGSGLEPFLANSFDGSTGFTFKPGSQFRFEQLYIYNRLGAGKQALLAGAPVSASIFNNHILRSKLNYQFTRELSLRAILDYNAVLPNSELVALERAKQLRADFLITYFVNPGTALYAGFTDGYENLAFDDSNPQALRRTSSPTTSVGRQFFVKMSYLFRF